MTYISWNDITITKERRIEMDRPCNTQGEVVNSEFYSKKVKERDHLKTQDADG
jgi:hypothetical protein